LLHLLLVETKTAEKDDEKSDRERLGKCELRILLPITIVSQKNSATKQKTNLGEKSSK
jgi:hypothetical protein